MRYHDLKQMEESQKLNRIKSQYECITCEIVVTKGFKHPPMSIVQGNGGPIEMAEMIKCLEDLIDNLTRYFPETKEILPLLERHGHLKEAYKFIEEERR